MIIKNFHVHVFIGIALVLCAAFSVNAQPSPELLEPLTRQQHYVAQRASSAQKDLASNGDARPVPAGGTLVLADLEGPGVISHIWCTIGTYDIFHGRTHVLRIYWDGEEKPSVEAPLGDFFGVGHAAAANFTSEMVAVSSHGRARVCYWRMPFHKSAKITLTNESDKNTDSFYYYIDWQKHEKLPEDTVYFHARYRQEYPAQPGDYTVLETEGRGHYVGTVQSVHQVEIGWFGEGDDRFYVDGEEYPSLSGTGTEDYYNDAWGFRKFDTPYYGVSLWDGYMDGDRVTAYRWHIRDPIPFTKSLRFEIEHRGSVYTEMAQHLGQFHERPDLVSSVAFWYQWPIATFDEPLPPASERVAPYRLIPANELEVRTDSGGKPTVDGPSVTYMPGEKEDAIEFDFTVPEDGTYQVNALMVYGFMGGVYQSSLNGKPLGEAIDFCTSGLDPVWTRFDRHKLKAGETHTLRFEQIGTSPRKRTILPTMNGVGMYYLVLLRLEDLPGYHEIMKRELERRKNQG